MILKKETTAFVRGGSLFFEPCWYWRTWQRDVWRCCDDLSTVASSHAAGISSPRERNIRATSPRSPTFPQAQ